MGKRGVIKKRERGNEKEREGRENQQVMASQHHRPSPVCHFQGRVDNSSVNQRPIQEINIIKSYKLPYAYRVLVLGVI